MRAVRTLQRSTTDPRVTPFDDTGKRQRPTFDLPSWLRLPSALTCAACVSSSGSTSGERTGEIPLVLPVDSLLLSLLSYRQLSRADVSLTLTLAKLLTLPRVVSDHLQDQQSRTPDELQFPDRIRPLAAALNGSEQCPCRWGCGRSLPPRLLHLTTSVLGRFPSEKSAPIPKVVVEIAYCGRGIEHFQRSIQTHPNWTRNAPRRRGAEYPLSRFHVQTLFAASYLHNLPLIIHVFKEEKKEKQEGKSMSRAEILKELEARFFKLWAILCGAALGVHSPLISWALDQWNEAVRLREDEQPRLPMIRTGGRGGALRRDELDDWEPMQRWQQAMIFACSVRSQQGTVPPLILPLVWTMPDLLHHALQIGAPASVVERILLHQRAEYTYRHTATQLSLGLGASANRPIPGSPFGEGPTFDAMVYQAFRVALKASSVARSRFETNETTPVEVLNYRMIRQWVSASDFKECFKELSPLCLIQSPWILRELMAELTEKGGSEPSAGGGVTKAKVLSYLLPNSWPLVDEATSQLHLFTTSEVLTAVSKCSRLAPLGFRHWVKDFLKRTYPAGVSSTRWSRDVTLRRMETGLGILHSDVFPERGRAHPEDEGGEEAEGEQPFGEADLPRCFC